MMENAPTDESVPRTRAVFSFIPKDAKARGGASLVPMHKAGVGPRHPFRHLPGVIAVWSRGNTPSVMLAPSLFPVPASPAPQLSVSHLKRNQLEKITPVSAILWSGC